MIRDRLIPALKREFAGWENPFDTPPQPIATVPAAQPAVGRVLVCDDSDEAAIQIEDTAHGHLNPHNDKLTEVQRDEFATEGVSDSLPSQLLRATGRFLRRSLSLVSDDSTRP